VQEKEHQPERGRMCIREEEIASACRRAREAAGDHEQRGHAGAQAPSETAADRERGGRDDHRNDEADRVVRAETVPDDGRDRGEQVGSQRWIGVADVRIQLLPREKPLRNVEIAPAVDDGVEHPAVGPRQQQGEDEHQSQDDERVGSRPWFRVTAPRDFRIHLARDPDGDTGIP
jgi:hypothetical protein